MLLFNYLDTLPKLYHKNESVPGVRTQHFAIRQRDMANLVSPGTMSQQCLPASSSHNHECHLERPCLES